MWHGSALISLRLRLSCVYESGQGCLLHPIPVLGWDMSVHHPILLPCLLQGEGQGTEPDMSWGSRTIGVHSWETICMDWYSFRVLSILHPSAEMAKVSQNSQEKQPNNYHHHHHHFYSTVCPKTLVEAATVLPWRSSYPTR